MPYRPQQFRPVPKAAEGISRSTPPATAYEVNATEYAPAIGTAPIEKKPTVRKAPSPRPRRLDDEPAIDMSSWSVAPDRVAHDMGLDFQ